MHCFNLNQIENKILSSALNIYLVELLNLKPQFKEEVFKKIKKNFKESFTIHE